MPGVRTAESLTRKEIGVVAIALMVIVLCFVLVPAYGGVYFGEDFAVFRGAALRLAHGNTDLYGVDYHPDQPQSYYFYNPPWTAVLMLPFTLVPERIGWAILSTLTLVITVALIQRWRAQPGFLIPLLALLSPPTIQVIVHGQLDPLVVATVFLPYTWWPIAAVMKPQAGIALVAGIPRSKWLPAALLATTIVLLSFVIFGLWPLELSRSNPAGQSNNLWADLWPWSALVGLAALILGRHEDDERLLIIASPLLFPYATIHSLFGAWVALATLLRTWQVCLLWGGWWAVTIAQAL